MILGGRRLKKKRKNQDPDLIPLQHLNRSQNQSPFQSLSLLQSQSQLQSPNQNRNPSQLLILSLSLMAVTRAC